MTEPLIITMHPADNVGIVANDGGLPAGAVLEGGLVLRDWKFDPKKPCLIR